MRDSNALVVVPTAEPIQAPVFYNSAKAALEKAHKIDEVKNIRDKAEALRAYAIQTRNHEMLAQMGEIKMRAERRAGEILLAMRERGTVVGKGGDRKSKSWDATLIATLEDLDITKDESSKWLTLAAVDKEQFENDVKRAAAEGKGSAELRRKYKYPQKVAAENAFKLKLKLPKGVFDVVVLDPQWTDDVYELGGEVRMLLDTSATKDSHIFLWFPNDYLQAAIRIMENCSLDFQFLFGWRKEGVQQGCNEEFAIYAQKGKPRFNVNKVITSFDAPVPKVGKPDKFYQMIASATKGNRLDAYSKVGKREGFKLWAKEGS